MAATRLFDFSHIDLNQVTVSAEEVGRLNPQCGAMRQLDHVIWISEGCDELVGVKHVTDDEFWVPLHIPGRPLMPGVLMIEAAAQLCSVQFHFRSPPETKNFIGFTRCDETVFRGQVVPGDTLHLIVQEVAFNPRRFVSRAQGFVGDRLVFESKLTGMTV
ncbi:MAG: beta-hydroxyacyl-ACP dehydratase [Planctomycetes bacterium]|nr:beta-hydroxyacyl-ACP dehydratase [Planctomycetota bacterium]